MRLLFVSLSLGVAALSLNGCFKIGDDDSGNGGESNQKGGSGGSGGSGGTTQSGGSGGSTAGDEGGSGGDGGGTTSMGGRVERAGSASFVERAGRNSGSAGAKPASGGGAGKPGTGGTGGKGGSAGTSGSAGSGAGTPGTCKGFSQQLVDCSIIDKPIECATSGSDPSSGCYYGCYEAASCATLTDYYCNSATNSVDDCLTACDDFPCGDGSTVPSFYTCDGFDDCSNGADEQGCVTAPSFHCTSGETVDGADRCDGYDQCTDSSDEAGCPALTCPQSTAPTPGAACADATANLKTCGLLPGGSMTGCLDRTAYSACGAECFAKGACADEVAYFCTTATGGAVQKCVDACDSVDDTFPCKTGGKSVPGNYVCDDEPDCDDGSDEADCAFKCATGNQSVTLAVTCDGYSDCKDGSDEAGCKATCP